MKTLFFTAALLAFSQHSASMTCIAEELDARYGQADFVFEATVTRREKLIGQADQQLCAVAGDTCGSKIATVDIGEVWKGEFGSDQTAIYSEDACNCSGTFFPVGAKYIVFGKKSGEQHYEVQDMGACWTEDYESADKAVFKTLFDLKASTMD